MLFNCLIGRVSFKAITCKLYSLDGGSSNHECTMESMFSNIMTTTVTSTILFQTRQKETLEKIVIIIIIVSSAQHQQ